MASTKYKLLVGILLFLSLGVEAQVGGRGSVYDSTVISRKHMPQANEFWNKSYNFPAKPRNMWEVGASVGLFTISGDFPALIRLPDKIEQTSFEVHVRKAFGYIFSMRLQYLNGWGKGLAWDINQNFLKNPAWNTNLPVGKRYFAPDALRNAYTTGVTVFSDGAGNLANSPDVVYYNYKTNVKDLSLQGIVTLNNIRFHKQKTGIVMYGGAGVGATLYRVNVNALDKEGNNYRPLFNAVFNKFGPGNYDKRQDIIKALEHGIGGISGMDNTYETPADNQGSRRPHLFGNEYTVKPSGTVLAGVAFKLGKRVNLAIEDRWTFVKDDLLDGQRWQEHAWGDATLTRDFDSYNFGSIGLNINLGAKSVEPLWWLNPLDYAYDELMNHRHVVIPPSNCPDADGDGICDHLDRCPNTPAGCPVDSHGCERDTDGDGVPDCKDKQLITPTECQPVDADGVGHCPDPECCKHRDTVPPPSITCTCDYPPLNFDKGYGIGNDTKMLLATIAEKMKARPTCSITLTGYPETSKASQAVCQKRLDAVKRYLTETGGILGNRIMTNCQVDTDHSKSRNTVDITCN